MRTKTSKNQQRVCTWTPFVVEIRLLGAHMGVLRQVPKLFFFKKRPGRGRDSSDPTVSVRGENRVIPESGTVQHTQTSESVNSVFALPGIRITHVRHSAPS